MPDSIAGRCKHQAGQGREADRCRGQEGCPDERGAESPARLGSTPSRRLPSLHHCTWRDFGYALHLPFPSLPFPSLQFPSLPFPPLPHGLAKLDPRMLLRSNYCRLAASKTDAGPQQCVRIFPKHALQARLAQTLLSVDIFPGECRFAGMLPEMLTHGSTGGSSYKYAGGDRVHRKKNHNPRKFGKR